MRTAAELPPDTPAPSDTRSATRILYVEGCRDGTVGGSHTCLHRTIANLDRRRFHPIAVFYDDHATADALRGLGVEVRILPNEAPTDLSVFLKNAPTPLAQLALPLRVLQKAHNLLWHFLRPAASYALLIHRLRINIVHLNNSLNTNHEWIVAAKLAGAQVVSHERGISYRLSRTSLALGRFVDAFICMSNAIQEPLLQQGLSRQRIRVVYDGLDTSELSIRRSPEALRATYGIALSAPVVGTVGNIKRWKGQETVIRATAILKHTWPDITCLFVGEAHEHDPYKQHLERLVQELGLETNVIFAGYQPDPWDFFNLMSVVIHSSIEPEPFGMVNLEAMYLGKACVSTTIGGPAEIFEEGRTGLLIPPGDPQALADKVALLLSRDTLRHALGRAANQAVVERFRIADTVHHIEAVYEHLCPASDTI